MIMVMPFFSYSAVFVSIRMPEAGNERETSENDERKQEKENRVVKENKKKSNVVGIY